MILKDGKPHCERASFTRQKTAYCRPKDGILQTPCKPTTYKRVSAHTLTGGAKESLWLKDENKTNVNFALKRIFFTFA